MNSTNNDFYKNAALKVFAQLGQLIEEDENKSKQINVLDSSTVILKDDKPKPVNLLDLNTDCISCIFPDNKNPFEMTDINLNGYYFVNKR
jgi:hypothetical protein